MKFSSEDTEKYRSLKITNFATNFGELIADEANDHLTPEQLFQAAADITIEQ